MDGERPDPVTSATMPSEAVATQAVATRAVASNAAETDAWAAMLLSDDHLARPPRTSRARGRRAWSVLSVLVWVGGVAGTLAATLWALERYFPEIRSLRGPSGDPPSVIAQPDGAEGLIEEWLTGIGAWLTSWPNVMWMPVLLAAAVGLAAGWVRWRVGRVARAEKARRVAERNLQVTEADLATQSLRLASLQQDLDAARHQVSQLTGQLSALSDRSADDGARSVRVLDDLEIRTKEVARLTSDLEDALTERDELEAQVRRLAEAIDGNRELVSRAGETRERLAIAEDLVERQGRRIDSLEQHLDRVRRRAAEMATEVRSAKQLRAAWAQAEEVIADLTDQLEMSERNEPTSFQPQRAAEIVQATTRSSELEALLNEAVDQLEAMDGQLQHTRLQLRERDAALARADAHQEAMATEVRLLTEEIELAAHRIAELEQTAGRQDYTDAVIDELRSALHAERDRARDLERQLRQVSVRALRLEERLIGHRTAVAPEVVDLTEPPVTEPAA